VDSGAALKALTEHSQDVAGQTWDDAHTRWLQDQQNRYGMLAGQSGQGLDAAGGLLTHTAMKAISG
jgi:hypothetical protein